MKPDHRNAAILSGSLQPAFDRTIARSATRKLHPIKDTHHVVTRHARLALPHLLAGTRAIPIGPRPEDAPNGNRRM